MNVLEEVAPNYIIQLPQGNKERQIHSLGFIDDKRYYVHSIKNETKQIIF